MGQTKESSSGTTTVNQTTTPTATPEEKQMEQIQLQQMQAFAPAQTQMYNNAFALGNQLLTSFGDKGGQNWQSLIGGVTKDQQQSMINEQDKVLAAKLQGLGIYDSGTAATARLRAATDVSNQNAQFNVGTLQNALNLALGGQAQVQAPAQGLTAQLASSLAGLRSVNTSGGTQANQTFYQNPFLQSFYSSAGQSLGKTVTGGRSASFAGASIGGS